VELVSRVVRAHLGVGYKGGSGLEKISRREEKAGEQSQTHNLAAGGLVVKGVERVE